MNTSESAIAQTLERDLVRRAERKRKTDRVVKGVFFCIAALCASIILFITGFILVKGILPFVTDYVSSHDSSVTGRQNFITFFTLTTWNGGEFNHGAGFLIVNTLYATLLSLILSIPISIFTALFIIRIAPKSLGAVFQSGVELLAGIPSVIFGLFGMGVISPFIKILADAVGYQSAGGTSLLSGVIILAMMSIPTMTSMGITAIKAVDPALIKASLALGASPAQTNFKVVLKDAQSGIFAGIILGVGRALGEATAVQMVIGNAASGPTFNPLDISSTLTTAILMGIGEATPNTMGYDIRFSAAILLIIVIFAIDIALNAIKDEMYAKQTGQPRKRSWLSKQISAGFHALFPKGHKRSLKEVDNG